MPSLTRGRPRRTRGRPRRCWCRRVCVSPSPPFSSPPDDSLRDGTRPGTSHTPLPRPARIFLLPPETPSDTRTHSPHKSPETRSSDIRDCNSRNRRNCCPSPAPHRQQHTPCTRPCRKPYVMSITPWESPWEGNSSLAIVSLGCTGPSNQLYGEDQKSRR